jgi:poly-gamma-glutamate biosynthesis protein PgsC/CapC
MIIEALFIGLIVGFIYYELVGISPGGVVAPGYFALFVHEPSKIAVTIVLALIVTVILQFLSRHLLIYGRRKLLLALLLGFCCKIAVDTLVQPLPVIPLDIHSIGYVIPGLIGSEMTRQKVLPTISSIIIVMTVVYLILLLLR